MRPLQDPVASEDFNGKSKDVMSYRKMPNDRMLEIMTEFEWMWQKGADKGRRAPIYFCFSKIKCP